MITFAELESAAPKIAGPIRERLEAKGIGLIATVRKDGSPRISPFEVSLIEGSLYVGSMPEAAKARDLQRDPRAALLTPVADKDDLGGEGKLFLHVTEITDPSEALRLLNRMIEGAEMSAEDFDGSPVFELQITGAAWQHVDGDSWDTLSWTEADGVRHRRRKGADGLSVEV